MKRKTTKRSRKNDPLADATFEEIPHYIFDHKKLTTPSNLDSHVLAFCKQLSPGQRPVYLDVQPESWSRLNYCNKNVEKMIQLNGGEMVLGYKIWYVKSLYAEADRHAVWRNPEGQLKDISYNEDGETRILFVHAPQISTVATSTFVKPRMAFHAKIREFIQMHEQFEQRIKRIPDDSWTGWKQAPSYENSKRNPKQEN